MRLSGISLKGIEIFCKAAQTGSIAEAATEAGLSLPAASQQIKKLETTLGCKLLDRQSRPMLLTRAGALFFERAKTVLGQLQQAQTELVSLDIAGQATLRLGVIEDFEREITPILLGQLSSALTKCAFSLTTRSSYAIEQRLQKSMLDIGIFTATGNIIQNVDIFNLLIDPYVVAIPKSIAYDFETGLKHLQDLQYITYDKQLIMGKQIEAQLARLRLGQDNHVEIDSYQSIFALIAHGKHWSITTPLAYKCASTFHKDVKIHPLPFQNFSRIIVLAAKSEWSQSLGMAMAGMLKDLLHTHTVTPILSEHPWLDGKFKIAD